MKTYMLRKLITFIPLKSENYLFGSTIIDMNESYKNNKTKIINAYNNLLRL